MTTHRDHSSAQNIYDDPVFFAGYKALRLGDTGINGAVEMPALCSRLYSLKGKRVLDLGCGFGNFARYARDLGAASVTAVDLSSRMLEVAIQLTHDDGISYLRCGIENYVPPPRGFDVVVSSMALHYVEEIDSVLRQVFSGLDYEGQFVFSVEHPVCTANPIGWRRDNDGKELHWPLDRYQDEGPRHTRWFVDNVIKYHRTTATYIDAILSSGFRLEALLEPGPRTESLLTRPELKLHQRCPPVLLFDCTRGRSVGDA